MGWKHYQLKEQISIRSMVTCFYIGLSKTFRYDGEKHDFWEIVYVDKGEIEAQTDSRPYSLKQGDLLFHEPNEFHNLVSNGKIAPDVFIVTFVCDSDMMSFFTKHKMFRLGEYERSILARLMKEGMHVYGSGTDSESASESGAKPGASSLDDSASTFASEQLVKIYIELLLIQLIRNHHRKDNRTFVSSTRNNQANLLAEKISAYISANLHMKWTLRQLCAEFGIGRTQINILFKEATGLGIIEYANQLKIEQAKAYIREEIYNFTEIAEMLGYSGVHYFSRHFKKATGMTPSEYSKSIKARLAVRNKLIGKK